MTRLVVIGAGGHGRVVADCARAMNVFESIVFLDDAYPEITENLDWPIIGSSEHWKQFLQDSCFFIALSNSKTRQEWLSKLIDTDVHIANIIHPSSICSPSIEMGVGNCIFANAVVNPAVKIANGCIINTGATVDHDCTLENGVHVSPGANLAGQVRLDEGVWIGVGASVIQCISIAKDTMVGAGAAVVKSIKESGTYVGVPAKKIK